MKINKTTQIALISSVGSILLCASYYFVFLKQKKCDGFALKMGSRGEDVMALQEKLGNLDIDGIFGEKTEARLYEVTGKWQITKGELDKL